MEVIKRDGSREEVKFDKIKNRITKQCYGLNPKVDAIMVAQTVVGQGLNPQEATPTRDLDAFAARVAASNTTTHPDYSILAGRIAISSMHKDTQKKFSKVVEQLYNYVDIRGEHSPLVSKELHDLVMNNKRVIDSAIIHDRDFNIDYFGFKTLQKSYLLKINGEIVERPQHMFMRVALGIHNEDLESALKTYDLMSEKFMTHATPTLFNAGTPRPQLSSCFLVSMKDDSIDGIFDTLKSVANISKYAGGLGIAVSNIRSQGTFIAGTNGNSNGIAPMLRVFNNTAQYVDQCFVPETQVVTDAGLKVIADVREGDLIKTSDNSFHEVKANNSFEYDDELILLTTKSGKIEVTPEHPMLVVRKSNHETKEQLRYALKTGTLVPEWIEAKNLLTTDKILKY